jgi:hypothetical protein
VLLLFKDNKTLEMECWFYSLFETKQGIKSQGIPSWQAGPKFWDRAWQSPNEIVNSFQKWKKTKHDSFCIVRFVDKQML